MSRRLLRSSSPNHTRASLARYVKPVALRLSYPCHRSTHQNSFPTFVPDLPGKSATTSSNGWEDASTISATGMKCTTLNSTRLQLVKVSGSLILPHVSSPERTARIFSVMTGCILTKKDTDSYLTLSARLASYEVSHERCRRYLLVRNIYEVVQKLHKPVSFTVFRTILRDCGENSLGMATEHCKLYEIS